MKSHAKHVKKTAKFLAFVLGRRPDEFGLVPDDQGYIPVKELLKAVHEEAGWQHLRQAHLNEVVLAAQPAPIEMNGKLVRAIDRSQLPKSMPVQNLPKLLYIAVRQRAYVRVTERGLTAAANPYLILSSDKTMALRLGQRRDNNPVLLSVHVKSTQGKGVTYTKYGETLYLTDFIPTGAFEGPPLPKQPSIASKPALVEDTERTPAPKTPGSYYVSIDDQPDHKKTARLRRQKDKDRQKARRHARKHKKDRYG